MNDDLYALDIETACAVEGCPWHGQAMCKNDHSLSPWHSVITVIGIVGPDAEFVFRGPHMIDDFNSFVIGALPRGQRFTMHGGKFDVLHLVQKGAWQAPLFQMWTDDSHLSAFIWTEKVDPAFLADYLENRPKHQRAAGPHSLKTLAPYFLGVEPYWEVEDKDSDEYVLTDTRHTRNLTLLLHGKMPADQKAFVDDKLLPWTKMLVEMELRGLKLDVPGLRQFQAELETKERQLKLKLDEMWADAHEAYASIQRDHVNRRYDDMKQTKATEPRRQVALSKAPTRLSYDSPTQMKWLLGEFYGYDISSLEGTDGTGKEVLIRLSEEGRDDVGTFLEWRRTQKILQAFIPKLLELRDKDDCIHAIYSPTGARTGRTSCERPNLQQTPSSLKKFFKPVKGKLIGYDQAAIEAKLIALYTEDPTMLEIDRTSESIHNVNTIAFFGLDCKPSDVPKLYAKQRKASKNCGFAAFYHAGAKRIRIALTQGGFPTSKAESRRMHQAFLEKFPIAMSYAKEVVEHLERGDTLPNILGRPIKIQDPNDAYMQGFNTLIQSSASDINLDRMHTAVAALRAAGIECYPVLTIHDYAGIEIVDSSQLEKADRIIRETLVDFNLTTSEGSIKLKVEGSVSEYWC